jgi:hypothetical protein
MVKTEALMPETSTPLTNGQAIGRRWSVVSFADRRHRLHLLKWLIPASLVFLVVLYEFGPTRLVHDHLGFTYHALLDTAIFGTFGPILAFVLLTFHERWLEERETSDLQAQIVAKAREEAERGRQLNDNAVQVLFAAGTLIATLKTELPDLPSETAAQINITEQALDEAVQELRTHLLESG